VNEETFMLTYGDGLSDVDMHKLLEFHRQAGKTATVTAVRQRSGLGVLELAEKDVVLRFLEKPANDAGWVSGGFFVFEPKIFDLLNGDGVALECEPLETLCSTSELVARRHEGFWKAMDTLRDKGELEELWNQGRAPWRIW
jgi:glucose-1-phosphate cytidylyltransferase